MFTGAWASEHVAKSKSCAACTHATQLETAAPRKIAAHENVLDELLIEQQRHIGRKFNFELLPARIYINEIAAR